MTAPVMPPSVCWARAYGARKNAIAKNEARINENRRICNFISLYPPKSKSKPSIRPERRVPMISKSPIAPLPSNNEFEITYAKSAFKKNAFFRSSLSGICISGFCRAGMSLNPGYGGDLSHTFAYLACSRVVQNSPFQAGCRSRESPSGKIRVSGDGAMAGQIFLQLKDFRPSKNAIQAGPTRAPKQCASPPASAPTPGSAGRGRFVRSWCAQTPA